jgi:hypothetical protein
MYLRAVLSISKHRCEPPIYLCRPQSSRQQPCVQRRQQLFSGCLQSHALLLQVSKRAAHACSTRSASQDLRQSPRSIFNTSSSSCCLMLCGSIFIYNKGSSLAAIAIAVSRCQHCILATVIAPHSMSSPGHAPCHLQQPWLTSSSVALGSCTASRTY